MKQTFINLNLLLIICAFSFSSLAQYGLSYPHGTKSGTLKGPKNFSQDWYKSNKETVFYEDFSDSGFDDWTIDGEGTDNWSASESNAAGGVAPEAYMSYYPVFLGTTRLISPVISTSDFTTLTLSFLHLIDSYAGEFWVGVETTSDGGTTWNEAWTMYWESTDNYSAFEVIELSTDDVGSEDFQFCFKFEDNSDLLDAWFIDNISLGDPILYDVTPTSLYGLEDIIYEDDGVMISADVKNYGSEIATFDVELQIDDGSEVVFTSTIEVEYLEFGDTYTVYFDNWTGVEGTYTAIVTTLLEDDEITDNDQITQAFPVFGSDIYCIPSADCSYDDGFTDFAFAGIENYGSGCSSNGYGVYTNLEGTVEIGSTYTATMATGYADNYASIWVDFNNDLEFQDYERILTDYQMVEADVMYDVDIVIPGFAQPGITTMRIGSNWADISSPDPCATFDYGEWEDYTLEITGESINYNAAVVSIDMFPVVEQGEMTPLATVKNWGVETISFPVSCTIDGSTYMSTVEVEDLGMGQEIQIAFDSWDAEVGFYTIEVATDLDGDEIPDNDVLTQDITIIEWAPTRMVVGEEGTGTWCGWCVRGTVYMDSMKMKYPDTWIGIAVHNGDPMLVEEYDAGIGPYIGYAYPGGVVDREIVTDPATFEAAYMTQISKVAPASIIIEDKTYNEATAELSFTLTSEFIAPVSEFRFNAVIVENNVTGLGEGWDQANYYSGGGYGPMGGYEDLPNPVPAEDMVYQDVARAILGGFAGQEGSLPESINAGESHSWDFTTTISEDWDMDNIEIVGMLIDQTTGIIENATKSHALVTKVNYAEASTEIMVYPNPATDELKVTNISDGNIYLYTINGQLLVEKLNVKGSCILNTSSFETGTYIVKIIGDKDVKTSKVNIIR